MHFLHPSHPYPYPCGGQNLLGSAPGEMSDQIPLAEFHGDELYVEPFKDLCPGASTPLKNSNIRLNYSFRKGLATRLPSYIPQAKVTQQHGRTDPAERTLGLLPSRIERVFDVPSKANRATKNDPS